MRLALAPHLPGQGSLCLFLFGWVSLLCLRFSLRLLGVPLGGAPVGAEFENLTALWRGKGWIVRRVLRGGRRPGDALGARAAQLRGLEAVQALEGQTHPRRLSKEEVGRQGPCCPHLEGRRGSLGPVVPVRADGWGVGGRQGVQAVLPSVCGGGGRRLLVGVSWPQVPLPLVPLGVLAGFT